MGIVVEAGDGVGAAAHGRSDPPPREPRSEYPTLPAGQDAGGTRPRWEPGTVIFWVAAPDFGQPMRVVRDDDRGLVAWLPAGSDCLAARLPGGRELREVATADRLDLPRTPTRVAWRGPGILRVAPAGATRSYWYFREEDGSPRGTYVNIELPHRRGRSSTVTRDLVLDLLVAPDGSREWKDRDELEEFCSLGMLSTGLRDWILRQGALAAGAVEQRAWPLDEAWSGWTPADGWDDPLPLPGWVRYEADEVGTDRRNRAGR